MSDKPNYLLDIPANEYHKATKDLTFLSSHRLHLFRRCPALYIKHANGEIVEEDTPAFIMGRATHTLVLEGPEAFAREYTVADGPVNPKTGAPYGKTTKAYLDWAAQQPLPIISGDDFELMQKLREAVQAHEIARGLLATGYAEQTVRSCWSGVSVQVRPDWYDPERNVLVDLKTCADVDKFRFDVRDFGYVFQLAFYARTIADARPDGKTPECWLVAVEKKEPYRVAVLQLLPYTIQEANEGMLKEGPGNLPMLEELKACREANNWPTRYEGFGTI